ncbi:MAG: site-specific DNA-methyltransferase [Planctomycetes bacterium]|nr:site-specific DNA-methyltransferase [Planctomycetota bacterium]
MQALDSPQEIHYPIAAQMSSDSMPQPSGVVKFPPASTDGAWWKDRILCGDSRAILQAMPSECVHLAITSPPYNVGLDYDSHHDKMPYEDYLRWLTAFWSELHRVLAHGGRFALNIAPTSIKDFRPVHYDMARDLRALGFIMRTEILWYKQAMRRRTAWGSWKSPSNPHMVPSWEYVLVFSKGSWTLEGNKADADITGEEFIKFSDAFWPISPETRGRQPFLKSLYPPRRGRKTPEAKEEGHPAPFPEELIYRLIKFYSYRGNVVLDPFGGTGTVAAVAHRTGRRFVHLDISPKYCAIAAERVAAETKSACPHEAPSSKPDAAPAQTQVAEAKAKYRKAKRQ